MIDNTCSVCGLPKELCVCSEVDKTTSFIEIKTEKRKYGKLWVVVSGVSSDTTQLKSILKETKNKLACAGTIKGKNIEILYGRNNRNNELIEILEKQGFSRDSIHILG